MQKLRYMISLEEDKPIDPSSDRWKKLEARLKDDTPESKQCVTINSFDGAERLLKLYESQSKKYAAHEEEIYAEEEWRHSKSECVDSETRQKERAKKLFGDSVNTEEKSKNPKNKS